MAHCVADTDGVICHQIAVIAGPVALCRRHQLAVAAACVPEILAAAHRESEAEANAAALIHGALPVALRDHLEGGHEQVVYFIGNGNMVKIGFTANLKNRLRQLSLRSVSVLLLLSGGPELERALHTRFARHRDGSTEWFDLSPEIVSFMSDHHRIAPAPLGATQPTDLLPADLMQAAGRVNAEAFAETGQVASIRRLRTALKIGQTRAQAVQHRLRVVAPHPSRQLLKGA